MSAWRQDILSISYIIVFMKESDLLQRFYTANHRGDRETARRLYSDPAVNKEWSREKYLHEGLKVGAVDEGERWLLDPANPLNVTIIDFKHNGAVVRTTRQVPRRNKE